MLHLLSGAPLPPECVAIILTLPPACHKWSSPHSDTPASFFPLPTFPLHLQPT